MNLEIIAKMRQNQEEMEKIFGKVEIETIIKKIKGQKLKQTERNYLSRSIRPKLRSIEIIYELKLSRPLKSRRKQNSDILLYNLDLRGYELIAPHGIKREKLLEIEELMTRILIQHPEPRFIEAIPILLIKNRIDPYTLFYYAKQYDLINQIGYLLEISLTIAKKFKIKKIDYLEGLFNKLKENKQKEERTLGRGTTDKKYVRFLKKTSPKRIRKWNLLGRYFDRDFVKLAQVYLK